MFETFDIKEPTLDQNQVGQQTFTNYVALCNFLVNRTNIAMNYYDKLYKVNAISVDEYRDRINAVYSQMEEQFSNLAKGLEKVNEG